jgi:hypothetical protein
VTPVQVIVVLPEAPDAASNKRVNRPEPASHRLHPNFKRWAEPAKRSPLHLRKGPKSGDL